MSSLSALFRSPTQDEEVHKATRPKSCDCPRTILYTEESINSLFSLSDLWTVESWDEPPMKSIEELSFVHSQFLQIELIYSSSRDRLNKDPSSLNKTQFKRLEEMQIYSSENLQTLWNMVSRIVTACEMAFCLTNHSSHAPRSDLYRIVKKYKDKRDFYLEYLSKISKKNKIAERDISEKCQMIAKILTTLSESSSSIITEKDLITNISKTAAQAIGSVHTNAVREIARSVIEIYGISWPTSLDTLA